MHGGGGGWGWVVSGERGALGGTTLGDKGDVEGPIHYSTGITINFKTIHHSQNQKKY